MVTGMYDGSNSYILHTNNQILQIKRTLLLMAWNNGHASRIVCKNASQITKQETKHTFFRQHFWVESLLLCLGGSTWSIGRTRLPQSRLAFRRVVGLPARAEVLARFEVRDHCPLRSGLSVKRVIGIVWRFCIAGWSTLTWLLSWARTRFISFLPIKNIDVIQMTPGNLHKYINKV